MEQLPSEIRTEICSHLPHVDLLSLSRTCRSFAAAVKPFLFETLTFHGDAQITRHHVQLRPPCDRTHPGPFKPVEVASLQSTIDEVLALDISRYATTFQYSPRFYMSDFWPRYREWVEEWLNEAVTLEDIDDGFSDAWDSDEEYGQVGVRREEEQRRARPEKEREITAKAELYWHAKVAEQDQKKESNHAALVRLFRSMPCLNRLQVMEWTCECELKRHGIDGHIDGEVGCQFADVEILNLHLETLGRALEESGTRIQHLLLPTVYGRSISRSPAAQYLFSALTSLSFTLHDPAEMFGDYSGPPPSFRTLIQCARHTLEKLEFSNIFHTHPQRPYRGEHLLEKFWGYEPGRGTDTLVFPRLTQLNITSLILYAPSLVTFLQAQPKLEKVVFRHVCLPTQGYGWPDIAAALPPTCHSLHIARCRGQPTPRVYPDPGPNSTIGCDHVQPFSPYEHPFPESCGWRASKSYLERETEKYITGKMAVEKKSIATNIDLAQSNAKCYTGPPIGVLLKRSAKLDRKISAKMQEFRERVKKQDHADYERVPPIR